MFSKTKLLVTTNSSKFVQRNQRKINWRAGCEFRVFKILQKRPVCSLSEKIKPPLIRTEGTFCSLLVQEPLCDLGELMSSFSQNTASLRIFPPRSFGDQGSFTLPSKQHFSYKRNKVNNSWVLCSAQLQIEAVKIARYLKETMLFMVVTTRSATDRDAREKVISKTSV